MWRVFPIFSFVEHQVAARAKTEREQDCLPEKHRIRPLCPCFPHDIRTERLAAAPTTQAEKQVNPIDNSYNGSDSHRSTPTEQ